MLVDTKQIKQIIKSAGLVFGDIGTSPIYTLTVVFLLTKPTQAHIIGILSLIFWTLTLLVSVQYAWLATSLSKKGEGGDIILKDILTPLLKSRKEIAFFTIITFIAISLLIGDGVITPAISILSAVEGMRLIPGLEEIRQSILIFIAALIAIGLFSFEKRGTEKVAGTFGPLMVLWFSALALSGLASILQFPEVLKALNPYYGIKFLIEDSRLVGGLAAFHILSNVILCATGGEALYADMGHLGRGPIVKAWSLIFVALILNYFGQGAFLALHPHVKNILFAMILDQIKVLYIPFLILSIIATVIASQAMISGLFSIVYQGITTRIVPMFKVDYTSTELRSQIYINAVNWFLMFFVLLIMLVFRESSNLASAYGLAVTGSMAITGTMIIRTLYLKKNYIKCAIACFTIIIIALYLFSNILKIPTGAYWSLIIAGLPLSLILIYTNGQKSLYKSLSPIPIEKFRETYISFYASCPKIRGTALFFARDAQRIPPYIASTMFDNNIIYEDNILVSINTKDDPFGIDVSFKEALAPGLRAFAINMGYMETIDVEEILIYAGIDEKVIFYGLEDISTNNPIWMIFAAIKRLTPSFVQFYKLPARKLHGIITRLEM